MQYNFKLTPRKKDILSKITDADIFAFYLGNRFKLNVKIRSPLRRDINPSFSIFNSSSGDCLLYKDHATGDSGDCFKLVMNLFNIDYKESLRMVHRDIIVNGLKSNEIFNRYIEDTIRNKKETDIKICSKKFNTFDIEYWNSFGISLNTLKKFKVRACSGIYINDKLRIVYSDMKNPIYSYRINKKYKIYSPFNTINRFINNCTTSDIQGLEQIKYLIGDLLIISKSLKDVMVLHELGYYSIAPNSETTSIPEDIMKDLKRRFKNIIVFYDNDKAGISGANKMAKRYNLKCIFMPNTKCKDISDFVKDNNIILAKRLIKKLLKNEKGNKGN